MITTKLQEWLIDNSIPNSVISTNKISIPDVGIFIELVNDDREIITSKEDDTMSLIITKSLVFEILDSKVDYIIYRFGGSYYYTPISQLSDLTFTLFRNLGTYEGYVSESPVLLGVHGRCEAMNGMRDYSEWCHKAKFLKYQTLGICERHTMGGILPFQLACNKAGVKPILGYTVSIQPLKGDAYDIKLFVVDQRGWDRLLELNKIINVDLKESVLEEELFNSKLNKGLIVVLPPLHNDPVLFNYYKEMFNLVYYQITTNEYADPKKDKVLLENLQSYIQGDINLPPILLSDSYCIEKNDVHLKSILNKQGGKSHPSTTNHYMRSQQDEFNSLANLFRDEDNRLEVLFQHCIDNLGVVNTLCNFQVDTKKLFLPQYEMTESESQKYSNVSEMFLDLINKGIENKLGKEALSDPVVIERLKREIDLITEGGFIDYFLITWDLLNYCKENRIEYGTGRGSAAGSLVSYALDIVKINPLQYGLYFERFMSVDRIKESLPDIDTDINSEKRHLVHNYIKTRYGYDYVCQVGTYTTLQIRGVLKELARAYGIRGGFNINIVTSLVNKEKNKDYEWFHLFYNAIEFATVKSFIKDNPKIVNDAYSVLNCIKTASIHASAIIIVPKIDGKDIYQQIPVRKSGDDLISEWDGEIMAGAGYLKLDMLGLEQVAKTGFIIDLIEKNTGSRIDEARDIPMNDPNVFELFRNGYNCGVFQFSPSGVTSFLKQMQPTNFGDLIATTALYRPGAMGSGSHKRYIKLKHGDEVPVYDWGTEPATKDTFGIMIYQEQIMRVVMDVAGFSPADSEGVRKATGKKIKAKMDSYRIKFIDGAIQKGCPEKEAIIIWNKIVSFAEYSFNLSHSVCYAAMGYYGNWFKYHYPLEYWTAEFQYSDELKDILACIMEIRKTGNIKIQPPNINKSGIEFYSSVEDKTIYWNLTQIKNIAEQVSTTIIEERNRGGKFFSVDEFYERVEKKVNKRCVEYLVLAGAFDDLYNVKKHKERYGIIKTYYDKRKDKMPDIYESNKDIEYFWSIRQGEVTGYSDMDYNGLIQVSKLKNYYKLYLGCEDFMSIDKSEAEGACVIAGNLTELKLKETKKDKNPFITGYIAQEDARVPFRIWSQEINSDKPAFRGIMKIMESEGRLCIMRGNMQYNDFIQSNELVLSSRMDGDIFQIF